MAATCANCGSHDVQANINNMTCLNCGKLSDFEGNPVNAGIDDATRDLLASKLEPPTTHIVGNLADLQRGGAAVVKDGSVSDGVEAPPATEPAE